MKVEIKNQYGEVLASDLMKPDADDGSSYQKNAYTDTRPYWTSSSTHIKAGHCTITIHNVDVHESVSLTTYGAPTTVGLLFLESGEMQVKQPDRSPREIGALQHNLIYNAQRTEETLLRPQQKLRLTAIHLPPDYFFALAEGGSASIDHMADEIGRQEAHLFATDDNLQISFPMLQLLNAFDSSAYNPASLRLYTEARILDLLSLQIEQIAGRPLQGGFSKLNQSDVKKLNIAREFILSDIASSPTLQTIALEAGINVYKLKTGFKALFGQSVFHYLREERLTTAYKEIAKKDKPLTDIAYETGFASISHFSDAFKHRYGVPPSQIR